MHVSKLQITHFLNLQLLFCDNFIFLKNEKKMMFHLESISESSSDCRDENEFQNENLVAVKSQ